MTLRLIDKSCGLYISEKRIPSEPHFPPSYFKKESDGWVRDQVNDTLYRYDSMVQRVFAVSRDRNLPPYMSDEELIQFNNRTIY